MKQSNNIPSPPKGGVKLKDILYALFKHKWKIFVLTLLGLGAAGALYHHYSQSPTYQTHAKLMVRYVVERREADPNAPVPKAGSVMMDSEQQILTSFDVARDAAEAMGPDKVLPDYPGEPSVSEAGARISMNLAAEAKRGSNVILIIYRDSDPQRAVDILHHVIQSYFARHMEIHRSTGAFDQVRVQAEQARSALRVIEDQINTLKSKSGVLSIDATMTEFETRRQAYRSYLMEAEAVLAQQRAKVAALTNSAPTRDEADLADAGNSPEEAIDPAQAAEDERLRREMAEAMFEYQGLASRLSMLRQERDRMLVQRPATHPMIQSLNGQIAQVRRQSLDLTERYPEFVGRGTDEGQPNGPATTIGEERALEAALEAKVKSIRDEVAMIEGQVENISKLGFQLGDLERRREMQEQKYRYYQTSLEKAEVDERLDPSKIPNISIVESPSNPARSLGEATMIIIAGVAASGLVLGLGTALMIEFVVRRRISKPGDIRNRLQLPLMMTIPYIRSRDSIGKLTGSPADVGLIEDSEEPLLPAPMSNAKKAGKCQEKEHFITPFARAIHDRIIFNFEINNLTHKPKLVAFAGLTAKAGTSTVAAGVAKAFSEEGNRKVLLVDLNPSAKGRQIGGHPADSLHRAIEHSQGGDFLQNRRNLHFASASTRHNGSGNAALAPIALQEIMPQLQASDYDYIIFDMPHVNSTSPTLAMAGFMDKVLLVVDGESTTPENLRWAYSELERGRADVSCIFNKARNHAPRWVLDDA